MQTTDTPQKAFADIRRAIKERDLDEFLSRVNLDRFMNEAYDEATEEFALNCNEFHALYPHDLFFQFGPGNIRSYNEKFRAVHLGFLKEFIFACFDKELALPHKFEADQVRFAAFSFRKLYGFMKTQVTSIEERGDSALISITLTGNFIYRKIIGPLSFVFSLKKRDDFWRLEKIFNVPSVTPHVLAIAERFWPKSWDLGITYQAPGQAPGA